MNMRSTWDKWLQTLIKMDLSKIVVESVKLLGIQKLKDKQIEAYIFICIGERYFHANWLWQVYSSTICIWQIER